MKTIQLTPRQRQDIEQRPRNAENRRIYQRLSVLLWIDDGRTREEVAQLGGAPHAKSASGSASSAIRGWSNSASCTTRVTPDDSDPPRSSNSSTRSPREDSTTPSKSAPGSIRPSE